VFHDYAKVLIFAFAGAGLVFLGMFMGGLLRPKRDRDAPGLEPYECGEEPIGSAWFRFDIRYYTVALVYIVFAVEIAFLFPWARVLKQAFDDPTIGGVAFLEGLVFIAVLALGLAYVWSKGDLNWVKELSDAQSKDVRRMDVPDEPADRDSEQHEPGRAKG
jgi:NADH-quinone oxidoreductase subunit A